MLGDDVVVAEKPCLSQLIEQFDKYNATVLGVQKVGMNQVSKYGIVDCDNVEGRMYKLKGMVEKPKKEDAPSDVAVLGRYVITPAIFDCLEKTPKGAGGEIQLTDALVMLAKNEDMYAYDFEGRRYDIGSKQGFLQATVDFALSRDDLKDEFAEYLKEVTKNLRKRVHTMKNKAQKLILTVLTMSTVLAFAACGNTDTVMESEPMETVETAESTETSTLEKESGDGKTESAAKADGTEVLPVTEVSASVTEKTEAESTVDIRQTVSQENSGTGENDKTGGHLHRDE